MGPDRGRGKPPGGGRKDGTGAFRRPPKEEENPGPRVRVWRDKPLSAAESPAPDARRAPSGRGNFGPPRDRRTPPESGEARKFSPPSRFPKKFDSPRSDDDRPTKPRGNFGPPRDRRTPPESGEARKFSPPSRFPKKFDSPRSDDDRPAKPRGNFGPPRDRRTPPESGEARKFSPPSRFPKKFDGPRSDDDRPAKPRGNFGPPRDRRTPPESGEPRKFSAPSRFPKKFDGPRAQEDRPAPVWQKPVAKQIPPHKLRPKKKAGPSADTSWAAGQKTLERVLSKAGFGSRTEARSWIHAGRVTVNGKKVENPDLWIDFDRDRIEFDGAPLAAKDKLYILLYKPVGYLSTYKDPEGRKTVYDLLSDVPSFVGTVGRLDEDSSGLLLLSNDNQFAERLTNPAYHVPKTYLVKSSTRVTDEQLETLRQGVELSDGPTLPAEVVRVRDSGNRSFLEITLREGRNRQVRRMVEAIGSKVLKLVRTRIGTLEIGDLESGKWRNLTPAEVAALNPKPNRA